jgi:hypothetical protein
MDLVQEVDVVMKLESQPVVVVLEELEVEG